MAEAKAQYLLDEILGKSGWMYHIPSFQRNYSWNKQECEELWDDIISTAEERGENKHFTHFMSDVVIKSSADPDSNQWMLIDGQQRITTILLLILAMAHHFKEKKDDLYKEYIKNKTDGKLSIKLKSVADDDKNLTKIVNKILNDEDISDKDAKDSQIVENYLFFKKKINEKIAKKEISHDDFFNHLLKGLKGLQVIRVILSEYDDANLIFEKINSTGADLSTSDLIRNYLLMQRNLKKQDGLYNDYWKHIEKNCQKKNDNDNNKTKSNVFSKMNEFFRYYLIVKNNKQQPRGGKGGTKLFKEFKKHFRSEKKDKGHDVEYALEDILLYSSYFEKVINNSSTNKDIRAATRFFNTHTSIIFYPLLLQLWSSRKKNLSDNELIKIIKSIDSFYFILAIYDEDTKETDKRIIFMMKLIHKEMKKRSIEKKENYFLNTIIDFLHAELKGNDIDMDNENFDRLFLEKVINKDYVNYQETKPKAKPYIRPLLQRLEYNLQSKNESIDIWDKQLEHILPQTIKEESQWKKDFKGDDSEEHKDNLWKLGNLTLTGYNQSYSNKDFSEKKSMKDGYDTSPMALNQSVKKQSVWTETEIDERTNYLAVQIVKMLMEDLPLSKQANDIFSNQYNLTEIKEKLRSPNKRYFSKRNRDPILIKVMEEEYSVDSWKDGWARVLEILYKNNPDALEQFVKEYKKNNPYKMFFYKDEEKNIKGDKGEDKIRAVQIADSNIWVKTNLAGHSILIVIIRISNSLKLKEDDIIITLRDYKEDEEE